MTIDEINNLWLKHIDYKSNITYDGFSSAVTEIESVIRAEIEKEYEPYVEYFELMDGYGMEIFEHQNANVFTIYTNHTDIELRKQLKDKIIQQQEKEGKNGNHKQRN